MSQAQPLTTLNLTTVSSEPTVVTSSGNKSFNMATGFGAFIFSFIILTVFIWLILYSTNPTWVRGTGGVLVDTGKVLLWSLIIALIIVIIFWIIGAAMSRRWSSC